MREIKIVPQELTEESFVPFGEAIIAPSKPAPFTGKGWECWFPVGSMGRQDVSIGIVRTSPTDGVISAMEREQHPEFLLPFNEPIVQVVALPADISDADLKPDANTVRAFIIHPGQAIVMHTGTWHWAALPYENRETTYLFAGEERPAHVTEPWIPFQGGDTVRVQMENWE